MNETMQTLLNRRSIRSYKPDMIPKETIRMITQAGTYAASGGGQQSPIILVVTDKKLRDRLSKLNAEVMNSDTDPFYGAPVVIAVLADKNRSTKVYDGSLVIGNMMTAAASMDIGSCWIHRAKEVFETEEGKRILKELGIVGEYEGIGNCILGYTKGKYPEASPRKQNYIYYS